ncbi:Rossmann-fold NAD(P)-binding domain-containing protein [Couchioplanes caeruleus]|uniref:hypothetical protein n=1 Tax=Couchioplanes caeruleus TaxID=56438 RepID=UPI001B80BC71|nr:hypothetical protein [Couchioplanes caeruleus]
MTQLLTSTARTPADPGTARQHWEIVDGWADEASPAQLIREVADDAGWSAHETAADDAGSGSCRLLGPAGTFVEAAWGPHPPTAPDTLEWGTPPARRYRFLLRGPAPAPLTELATRLGRHTAALTAGEADAIWAAMPLTRQFAEPDDTFPGWALIFRDHYVENSVGFLLGMERAGLDPRWIYALAKGDRTRNRDRVHAWFLRRGYASDVLDNSVINGTAGPELQRHALGVLADVERFVHRAHEAGRRVLVVDDGGLLAQGYGSPGRARVDAAIELTVSGLKRIEAVGALDIPVVNLARSGLKTCLGYNEIADSCLRRLRAILPGEKFTGRRVLCLGYGTLGARMARGLRAVGCRVAVVDTDPLMLIEAAEHGFETYRSLPAALAACRPFLVIGNTGEAALAEADLPLLPDGVYLAGFATKDFSVLTDGPLAERATPVPGVGRRYALPHDRTVTLLGDGRSLNLFEYEGIPNRGYDAYRAGTLIAARALCRRPEDFPIGAHTTAVDRIIGESGLFEAYYDRYLADA